MRIGERGCVIAAATVAAVLTGSPAMAAIDQQFFVSANNKLYFVLKADASSGVGAQVTSIMMTNGTTVQVNETLNDPPDPVLTSFSTLLNGGILNVPPLSNLRRTGIISGFSENDIIVEPFADDPATGGFDPDANGGNGLLLLPGGTRSVSFDGSGTEPVQAITTASGAGSSFVPPAQTVVFSRRIGSGNFFNVPTIVFPNPGGMPVLSQGASCVGGSNPGMACDPANPAPDTCLGGGTCSDLGGEAMGQNVTLDDTVRTRIGNPASQGSAVDGFLLRNTTDIIVFMVDAANHAFALSASGFSVTGTCDGGINVNEPCLFDAGCPGSTCGFGLVGRFTLDTTGDADNQRFYTPTPTPTVTPTPVPECGNGIVEIDEQCDDGNLVDGDCCAANCLFEAPGSPCAGDSDTCTLDECDGGGTCVHPTAPNGTPCEDGNPCTAGEVCTEGACGGGSATVCDDADSCTIDSCDPSVGCLFEIGVESPECGTCADGEDNDGDGVIDAENPNCSSLFQLQRFAIVGTATIGERSVRLGRKTEVVPDADFSNSRAGACGVDMRASIGAFVSGTVALAGKAKFSGGQPPVRIGLDFVNTGGQVAIGPAKPLVGPPAMCAEAATSCTTDAQCPPHQRCSRQMTIDNPRNSHVNLAGDAPDMLRCLDTLAAVPSDAAIVTGLTATKTLGAVRLRAGDPALTISLGGGQQVVDMEAFRLGRAGRVVISGGPDTVAVLRIAGTFRVGTQSRITLDGGLTPDRVLWNIQGPGRAARVGTHALIAGTIIAAQRLKISIGAFSVVQGSLAGKRIQMGLQSEVHHVPFTPLLVGATEQPATLSVRKVALRYDNSDAGDIGGLRVTGVLDDNDTGGIFEGQLLSDAVTVRVHDAAYFDVTVPLTRCRAHGSVLFRCRSSDGRVRATIARTRTDPRVYNLSIIARRLPSTDTGTTRPLGPATVTLDESPAVQRTSTVSTCRPRGALSLVCRRP